MIALVDCNSFFCSCERLLDPNLKQVPVGVLSNNDGCFISVTKELKLLGPSVGDPYFKFKKICEQNNAKIFSLNFSLYSNMSYRVMDTLRKFTPKMEVYSVDEAFLDLTGINTDLTIYAKLIKKTVEKNTGIPVSVGIGPTKTLSKIANYIAKNINPDGVSVIDNKSELLSKVKVEKVWGIGRKKFLNMKKLNIKTAKDLRDFKNDKLILSLFTKVTRMTQDELRGIVCFPLETETAKKKEIISSRSFSKPVTDLESLKKSVAKHASRTAEKLRLQNSVCELIEVHINTSFFKTPKYYGIDQIRLQTHTSDTRKLIANAWKVLNKIYKKNYEYKRSLVKLSGIASRAQLSFFDECDTKKSQALMKSMDFINLKEGPETLKSAGLGVTTYKTQSLKSKRHLTGFLSLPKVL